LSAAPAQDEQVLDLTPEPSPAVPATSKASSPREVPSTEDILGDFLVDLEKGDLADFAPKARPEAPTATVPQPAAAPAANGALKDPLKDADSASVLNDIFSDLQEEGATTTEAEEDPETHYNLGIAFKEMGLLDESIGELQKVCRAVDRGQKFSQPIQAYTWLAQCLVDKGAPEAALRWYNKALQLPGLDDSSRNAIYYDLAVACEASGDKKSALANFMEVYGSNIDFRDVASRIKALKS
jgi:tetratricopeptide (TPR) repeat protein